MDASAQGGDGLRPMPRERTKEFLLQARPTANPCAQFGPGFVRAAGSDTCVRLGGGIGVGVGGSVMPGR